MNKYKNCKKMTRAYIKTSLQQPGSLRMQNEDASFELWVCKKRTRKGKLGGGVCLHTESKLCVRAMWSGEEIKASGTMVSVSNFRKSH